MLRFMIFSLVSASVLAGCASRPLNLTDDEVRARNARLEQIAFQAEAHVHAGH